ncbi:MAG: GTPase domain-containing protein [Hydrogenothermaceae bacterium]|nr:GTPase domain-containing protein [Hydrogenothermaceae bacterium]
MREIFIVYHGLGMAGKTTNLEFLSSVFQNLKIDRFHQSTVEGRTVYLDMLLMAIKIKGSEEKLKVRLFSTPGQERFSVVRSWIFSNADGFVFIVDPTQHIDENLRSYGELREYTTKKPVVIQINKTDIVGEVDSLKKIFGNRTVFTASAKNGVGVRETFLTILKEVIENGVGK